MPDTPAPDSRRTFLKDSCRVGALLAFGTPLLAALSACDSGSPDDGGGGTTVPDGITVTASTVTIDLSKSGGAPLASPGGFLFLTGARTVVVNDAGTIRAFSSECPHEGQSVNRLTGGQLVCPTHDSRFNPSTGAVVSGPARRGLTVFPASRSGDTVTITRAT